jgi:short-subunit dehydrogenase
LKPLRQQVIVITGATSGIGLATARLAAARGARLVLAARSEGALRKLVGEIERLPGQAIPIVADVAVEADVERVATAAAQAFGGFDTWINNAACSAYGSCAEVSVRDMRRIMDTNFWGTVFGSRAACAALRHRGGALINVGSIVSDTAVPLQGAYSASKHAIKGWTDALRIELAHDGAPVSVTLVKPSAIDTPYAEHASNYFRDEPTHVPPVYHPRSAARAILYAAEHPIREITVGAAGVALAAAKTVAPSIVDALMSRLLIPGMHSGRAPHGRPSLFTPSEDLREQGRYAGFVRPSVYTALRTRPAVTGALAAGSVLFAMWWHRQHGGTGHEISRASGSLR